MPIKIGKSKSSSGSELIHTNSCPDESNNQTKKNRGIRQFFNRSNRSSKTPTEDSTNAVKTNRNLGKTIENIIGQRTESSPVNMQSLTCHSVSPKLYTNSCASSTEELSKVALSNISINSSLPSAVIPCSPIQDVIFEEDYEEALLLNSRTEPPNTLDNPPISRENTQQPINITKKISQGIYNEPNDSAQGMSKEIIETCRICQITPTNQFKEIRSRSGSDTDPLLVHPDLGVGGRCSTNSSSVGSAMTLSESPAVASSYSPQIHTDTHTSPNIPPISSPINSLSININTNAQPSSGPPTVYTHSPKGNTVICHHPSSPFSPPPVTKPSSSSNPTTTVSTNMELSPSRSPMFCESQCTKISSSVSNIISRRPGRFGKPTTTEWSQSTGKQSTDGVASLSDLVQPSRPSEIRSEYYSKHPVYEEAWDLKLKRMCVDMAEKPSTSSIDRPTETAASYALPIHAINVLPYNRPQSAAGARRRTDSPGSKYSSPPAVPPHRRSSAHIKITHCNSFEDSKTFSDHSQTSQSITDCRSTLLTNDDSSERKRSHLKHNINPSFDDQGITTDYDYAYNETWSLGVQLNMALNLSNTTTEACNAQRKDSVTLVSGYMDKIDSAGSEESSSLSTSQETPSQIKETQICDTINNANLDEENANLDNDSLSNDSYEEPWDVRHGRVISELTSARLIDPACVLSVHDQIPSTKQHMTSTPSAQTSHINHPRSNLPHEQSAHNSPCQQSSRHRSISGGRRMSNSTVLSSSSSLINKSIVLDDQPWYHDNCSRSQAEQLLVGAIEGSFLVRKSETSKNDYSLTIRQLLLLLALILLPLRLVCITICRHKNDYLHMKISRNSRGFILGQYSQPYVTIPHMLHHYSLTMVPVRGADAVILKNPIIR